MVHEFVSVSQVVGLTASVGIGNFKSQQEAESNILQLCANLDTRVITTVTKHLDELRSYVHTPEKRQYLHPITHMHLYHMIINVLCMFVCVCVRVF